MNTYFAAFACLFLILDLAASGKPPIPEQTNPATPQDDEDCGLDGYEAHCVLDIMEEHIDATAIINHCHFPLDITFRVIYRYGNGSEQRWQYTFVTSNQNERVLIPGLLLPLAPHALVYLFVRVPQPLFDLHNASVAAVEASFVAILADDKWEEVEFLNEAFVVTETDDCFTRKANDPLLYIIGGSFLGLLFVGSFVIGSVWCYKRRKLALDELALVSSIEIGLPGAQPYQISQETENYRNNNNISKEAVKNTGETQQQNTEKSTSEMATERSRPCHSGFKFGRLKEEDIQKKQRNVHRIADRAIIIGNPDLVDKTSLAHTKFNVMSPNSSLENATKHSDLESPGDAFQNVHSKDMIEGDSHKRMGDQPLSSTNVPDNSRLSEGSRDKSREKYEKGEMKQWENHPLEFSEKDGSGSFSNGARPKCKNQEAKIA